MLLLSLCIETLPRLTAPLRLERIRMRNLTGGVRTCRNRPHGGRFRTCFRYRVDLRTLRRYVSVEIGVTEVFAIALREGKPVATALSANAALTHVLFRSSISTA